MHSFWGTVHKYHENEFAKKKIYFRLLFPKMRRVVLASLASVTQAAGRRLTLDIDGFRLIRDDSS